MTVLSDLGVLWRWSAEKERAFAVDSYDKRHCVMLEHHKEMEDGTFVHEFRATTRGGALAAAARWARKQMGEGG